MKKIFFLCAISMCVLTLPAAEYSYVWSEVFPNYKQQIPSSDFDTPDGHFRFTTEKADGASGPQFGDDNKAGLLLRLYADNTLRIEHLQDATITDITFVIGGNGHYKLADLTPSTGAMQDPYLGKDETGAFKEYRLFWMGSATAVTFTVGHECEYGIQCNEGNTAGTCMTKQIIITTTESEQALDQTGKCKNEKMSKFLRDGQLFIERDGKLYNAQGVEIK